MRYPDKLYTLQSNLLFLFVVNSLRQLFCQLRAAEPHSTIGRFFEAQVVDSAIPQDTLVSDRISLVHIRLKLDFSAVILQDLRSFTAMQRWDVWLHHRFRMYIWEAVEESTDKDKEPDETGDAPVAGLQEWKLSERILGGCRKRYSYAHDYKKRLAAEGYFEILNYYESLHLCG